MFELLGPTVYQAVTDAHYFRERLDTDTIIRAASQMLEGLAFLHEAGYAHGGIITHGFLIRSAIIWLNLSLADLSSKNLAFYNSRLSCLSEEELFEALGPPEPEDLIRLDGEQLGGGLPVQLVESAQWTGWPFDDDDDDLDENIRIIDLGEAFGQDNLPKKLAQPAGLQAPETICTGNFDYRQDLWRAGLVVRLPLTPLEIVSLPKIYC